MFSQYECDFLKFFTEYMRKETNIESGYIDTDSAQVLFYNSGPKNSFFEKFLHRSIRIDDLQEMMLKIEKIKLALEKLKNEVPEILI